MAAESRKQRLPITDALLHMVVWHWGKIDHEDVEDLDGDLFHDDEAPAAIVMDRKLRPHARVVFHHFGQKLNAKLGVVVELAVELLLFLDQSEALFVDSASPEPTCECRRRRCPTRW